MTNRVLSAAAVAAFAFPLLAVSGTPAPVDPAAVALIAKHQAYVGWHAGDGVVKTLRESGALVRDGKEWAKLEYVRYGLAHRAVATDSYGQERSNGFTGSVYWTSNENGFTVRPVGEIARYLFDVDVLRGELSATLTPAIFKHATVDGTDTTVVRLTSEVGLPMEVYVDAASGAYKRVVIDPDGKYEELFNGIGYTQSGAKHFMSTWHYGDSKYIQTYAKIEPNANVAPDELRPPKQTATWTFGEGTARVELTQDTFPRILIDVTMNGMKARFILDTGAAHTVLTDSFARKIGAKQFGKTALSGIGGSVAANLFRIDSIGVGGSTLHNVVARSGLAEEWMQREGVAGLIGFDLLGGAIVDLDLDAKTLLVLDPSKVEPDQTKGVVVHADLSTQHIRVPMKLNEKYDVIALLDSGNPLNVLFSRDLITRDHLTFFVDPGQLGSTRYGGGVGGFEIEHCGRLGSLNLGPISYRPVPACDSSSESRNEILVGLDFMKNFNYVFSYPDGIVVMIPRKNP
jgi:Aspartyl protease